MPLNTKSIWHMSMSLNGPALQSFLVSLPLWLTQFHQIGSRQLWTMSGKGRKQRKNWPATTQHAVHQPHLGMLLISLISVCCWPVTSCSCGGTWCTTSYFKAEMCWFTNVNNEWVHPQWICKWMGQPDLGCLRRPVLVSLSPASGRHRGRPQTHGEES